MVQFLTARVSRGVALLNDIIVGLDIGTCSIKVAIGQLLDNGEVNIIGLAQRNSQGLRNGTIVNIEAVMSVIKGTIEDAEQNAGIEVSAVVTAIGGMQIESMNSKGQVAIAKRGKDSNGEITQQDVNRVLEAANAVTIPMDREMLHVIPQCFIIDGINETKDPVHMIGVRLEAEVHLVTASKTAIQNVRSCISRAGYNVDMVMLKTLAATQAVVHQDELELGSILIDMGAGTTDVLVLIKGSPVCSFSIMIGGNLVTSDISIVTGISIADAERIKIESGCCYMPSLDNPAEVVIPGVGGRPPELADQTFLCQIIQPRMEEIFSMVKDSIIAKTDLSRLSGNIILTGGCAMMDGAVELAQQVFGTAAVRVGIPKDLGGISEQYRNSEYATVIGLVESQKSTASASEQNRGRKGGPAKSGGILKTIASWFF